MSTSFVAYKDSVVIINDAEMQVTMGGNDRT